MFTHELNRFPLAGFKQQSLVSGGLVRALTPPLPGLLLTSVSKRNLFSTQWTSRVLQPWAVSSVRRGFEHACINAGEALK